MRPGGGGLRLTILAFALSVLGSPLGAAAEPLEFPAGYEGYHTYAEMEAALDAAVAAYGNGPGAILARHRIGYSHQGRNIWAIKISDNAAVDESEPEVLSIAGMHAREHITVEMALYLVDLLTANYGRGGALGERVTKIVDSREVWIVPLLNPDGAEYDIAGGSLRMWRKNRQPIPGSDAIGIDINRNFGFKWGCCAGGSDRPGSIEFRGQHPWQATENVVLRDFVLSRRVEGRQQIRALLNWHSYGELVLWPFAYTKTDVPRTMTRADHRALVALGTGMAARNGYTPRQGSDMYIYDGDVSAWAYGNQRILAWTLEMYPGEGSKPFAGFYPPDDVIGRETGRNRDAVLYALEHSDCPYRAAGLGATHCGPLYEDFETRRGWAIADAAGGGWQRARPRSSSTGAGIKQRAAVPSGQAALVTGALAGRWPSSNDLDGATSALSPAFRLDGGTGWQVTFSFAFAHDARSTSADFVRVSVVAGGVTTPLWSVSGRSAERNARWRTRSAALDAHAGQEVRLLIEARDGAADNLVEAAIDDIRVFRAP